MKTILVYFGKKEIVSNLEEAVNFVNSLQYRGNSYKLSCSENCKSKLGRVLSGEFQNWSRVELTTTGIGNTRILAYPALADSIEDHDRILAENKAREEAVKAEKKEKAYQEFMQEAMTPLKGWYVVTLDISVSRFRGNDGIKTYSFKVLADSQYDAYNKAQSLAMEPGGIKDRNVSFVYSVADNIQSALIEYVGVWTDASEIEYGPEA